MHTINRTNSSSLSLLPTHSTEHAQLEQALSSLDVGTIRSHLTSKEKFRTALSMAIQRQDKSLTDIILKEGAIPDPEHIRDANNEIRTLLTYARRKHILYPSLQDSF